MKKKNNLIEGKDKPQRAGTTKDTFY